MSAAGGVPEGPEQAEAAEPSRQMFGHGQKSEQALGDCV